MYPTFYIPDDQQMTFWYKPVGLLGHSECTREEQPRPTDTGHYGWERIRAPSDVLKLYRASSRRLERKKQDHTGHLQVSQLTGRGRRLSIAFHV